VIITSLYTVVFKSELTEPLALEEIKKEVKHIKKIFFTTYSKIIIEIYLIKLNDLNL
tara:strand:+ start:646 stop:816 length:171 start_codon:yes stop_codon:yes gene_type:complete